LFLFTDVEIGISIGVMFIVLFMLLMEVVLVVLSFGLDVSDGIVGTGVVCEYSGVDTAIV
jgi:hypothetical protein